MHEKIGASHSIDHFFNDRRRFISLVIFCIASIILIYHIEHFHLVVDDTYISLRYARNLLEGKGLVFNPGERVEGYTNFLWVMLLAFFMKFKINGVVAARLMGLIFSIGTLFMVVRFSHWVSGRSKFGDSVAAMLIAFNGTFALWAGAGLENSLFVFIVLLGQILYLKGYKNPNISRGICWGFAFAVAYLLRPDGALFFVAAIGLRLIIHRHNTIRLRLQEATAAGLAFGIPVAIHFLWRLHYYGDWFPNTFYAKTGINFAHLKWGLLYANDFLKTYSILIIIPVILLFLFKKNRDQEISLLIFGGLYLIYIILIGGDRVFPYFRFFMVILPNLYLLIGRGTELIWETCIKKSAGVWAGGVIVSLFLVIISVISVRASISGEYWQTVKYNSTLHEDWVLIGKWLAGHFPPDTWTAMWRVGMIPYYSGLPTIDMLGLTDRHIAGCPSKGYENLPGHEKHDFAYVLNRKPVIILYWDILFDEAPDTLGFHSVKHNMIGFQELAHPEVRKQFEREYTFRVALVEGKHLCFFVRKDYPLLFSSKFHQSIKSTKDAITISQSPE